jgi:hypothetical protein
MASEIVERVRQAIDAQFGHRDRQRRLGCDFGGQRHRRVEGLAAIGQARVSIVRAAPLLRPNHVQQLGQTCAALGQLPALDGIHGPQVGVVILEYDGPFAC